MRDRIRNVGVPDESVHMRDGFVLSSECSLLGLVGSDSRFSFFEKVPTLSNRNGALRRAHQPARRHRQCK